MHRLSKLIPVLMHTTYTVTATGRRQRATWVQWRGHIWAHRITPA